MRYCYNCGRFTAGEPVYCNFCARSYHVKLCPRLHVNPRPAEVCSQCGSRDLSIPQPKVPFRLRIAVFAVMCMLGSGILLLTALFAAVFLQSVLTKSDVQTGLLGIGIMLAVLWWIWLQMPSWFRKTVYRLLQRKRKGRER